MTAPGIQWIDVQFNAMQSKRGGIKNPVRQFKAVSSENTSLIWEKKTVTLWDSCHAPLCTSPVTPSKVFYFLVRPEGLPKKSRLSYPLYRWEVRPGRSSICQFFGEFWNQLVAKQKQKTAKTQISPGLSSFISIATTRCTSAFMRHFRPFFTCNRRSILNQRRGRTWIAQTFP